MHIGVLQFSMAIPHAQSLKDKRSVVQSLKDQLRKSFNVSIAEVDDHEIYDLATLGCAVVGTDVPRLNGALDKLLDTLDAWRDARLEDHQLEILSPR